MPKKNRSTLTNRPKGGPITLTMEDDQAGYIVAAVEVSRAIRFYTARSGQQAACEQELARDGLRVLVWGEGPTEEDAMAKAMQLAALEIAARSKPD